jgi:HlyD family secretion protein
LQIKKHDAMPAAAPATSSIAPASLWASRPWLLWLIAAVLAGGAWLAWSRLKPAGLPEGIASGNGRIEATEVDIATRAGGRLLAVNVHEGEEVQADQVLATMDTATLDADFNRAQAQLAQARNARVTAAAMLAQREQAVSTAQAVVRQRDAELNLAQKQWQRTQELVNRGFLSPQKLDEVQAQVQSAAAGRSAALSQVAEARTAITAARSQQVEADSAVNAAQAAQARVQADRHDTALRAPRAGRVQVLAAQAGEVLGAGGRVLSLADLSDVQMTFFLPEVAVGRLAIGAEARLVLDAAPQYVIPAQVSYVASVAQFTPKTVETQAERQKMVFKVRARIAPELLARHHDQVKTGLPGMAYVRLSPDVAWPDKLAIRLPQAASAVTTAATTAAASASQTTPGKP